MGNNSSSITQPCTDIFARNSSYDYDERLTKTLSPTKNATRRCTTTGYTETTSAYGHTIRYVQNR